MTKLAEIVALSHLPSAQYWARIAQRQAETLQRLMHASGMTKEEIQHHAMHSIHSLAAMWDCYRAYKKLPCVMLGYCPDLEDCDDR